MGGGGASSIRRTGVIPQKGSFPVRRHITGGSRIHRIKAYSSVEYWKSFLGKQRIPGLLLRNLN